MATTSRQVAQVTQKGFGLLDARITLDLEDQGVTLAVFGRNLTGKEYHVGPVQLEAIGFNTVIAGEPRAYGFEVTRRFGNP